MFTLMFGSYTFPNKTFEVEELPLNNNIQEDSVVRKHGSTIQAPYLKSRTIRISGTIHNNSSETSLTQLMAMQEALFAGEDKFYHRSDRYISCFIKSLNPEFKKGTDKAVIDVDISFIAQDPFFYSAGVSLSVIQNAVNGVTIDFDVSPSGNVFSESKIFIYASGGTINDDITLINLSNSEKFFKFRGILADGTTLEIDSKDCTVLNNEVDGLSNFEGDFLTLVAGSNSFQFCGGTCRIEIDYKNRWY